MLYKRMSLVNFRVLKNHVRLFWGPCPHAIFTLLWIEWIFTHFKLLFARVLFLLAIQMVLIAYLSLARLSRVVANLEMVSNLSTRLKKRYRDSCVTLWETKQEMRGTSLSFPSFHWSICTVGLLPHPLVLDVAGVN